MRSAVIIGCERWVEKMLCIRGVRVFVASIGWF